MPTLDTHGLPDVAGIFAQLLGRVSVERQPLLLAIAERMAADRYRGWAAEMAGPEDRDALHACAAREEEIATRIERLDPDAAVVQRALRDELPDLESITRSVFDRPLTEQLRVQAMGERLGAAT